MFKLFLPPICMKSQERPTGLEGYIRHEEYSHTQYMHTCTHRETHKGINTATSFYQSPGSDDSSLTTSCLAPLYLLKLDQYLFTGEQNIPFYLMTDIIAS